MDDGPYWVILLMYGSHDMRHTGFRRLTIVNGTPGFWGVTLTVKEEVVMDFFLKKRAEVLDVGIHGSLLS